MHKHRINEQTIKRNDIWKKKRKKRGEKQTKWVTIGQRENTALLLLDDAINGLKLDNIQYQIQVSKWESVAFFVEMDLV